MEICEDQELHLAMEGKPQKEEVRSDSLVSWLHFLHSSHPKRENNITHHQRVSGLGSR